MISDEDNDIIIMVTKKCNYLSQLINNCWLSENTIGTKMFGKFINKQHIYNNFSKSSKIKIFKTYLLSKINHLFLLRKIIFKDILNR